MLQVFQIHYTVWRLLSHDVMFFYFFWKFRLLIWLHSSCCISPTASGRFQKCFTKVSWLTGCHTVYIYILSLSRPDKIYHHIQWSQRPICIVVFELTFNVQLDEGLLAHAKRILRRAAVQTGCVSRHGAEVDLGVRAEDAVEAVFPPEYRGRRIAVRDAAQRGRVLLLLQVRDLRRLDSHGRRICGEEEEELRGVN